MDRNVVGSGLDWACSFREDGPSVGPNPHRLCEQFQVAEGHPFTLPWGEWVTVWWPLSELMFILGCF